MQRRIVAIVGLACAAAWALPDDWEREVDKIHAKLEMLRAEVNALHEEEEFEEAREQAGDFVELARYMAHEKLMPLAERLAKRGKKDAANIVRHRAQEILHEAEEVAKHVREFDRRRHDPEEILEGLVEGIEALRALGKHEEAEHLEHIAEEVEKRVRHHREEREIAEHRLEVFRLAHHAFREAEKREAAEAMEHLIHAFELRLEGRDDEKARRIWKSMPDLAHQSDLLIHAGRLWADFGHERKARHCKELGRELRETWEREHRGKGPDLERVMERIERLEERLDRMERYLKKIAER